MSLTKEQLEAYKESPHTCPFCGSEEIEAVTSGFVDSGGFSQPIKCLDCEQRWEDLYCLVGVYLYSENINQYFDQEQSTGGVE